ncbi:hypothetical protein RJ640_015566 [Escallonia rubra]|uniref:Tify domain-containing protein n=1 Tax=Escallonia rubra TaxID=112253 RepID=A0AA88QU87_9ASTE|nr:hypothetical protein RJ640_015566 [Escallonia rubra]
MMIFDVNAGKEEDQNELSFHEKAYWMARGEPKRSHPWFGDAAEPELFPNKKQAVQAPNSKLASGISTSSVPWESATGFQAVPHEFIDRLFGSESNRPVNFIERNISPVGTENSNMRKTVIDEQYGNDSSVGLSMSYSIEDPEAYVSYGGLRKVKVNEVKDPDNGMQVSKEHTSNISMDQVYNRGNETNFITIGGTYGKEDGSVTLMGHAYNGREASIRPTGSTFVTGEENALSIGHSYNKGDPNTISFGGYQDESDIGTLARPINNFDLLYNQSSVQTSEISDGKELDASNTSVVVNASPVPKLKPESLSKLKLESKSAKKDAPNSFPSNVRSLIATGMLDGVPIKYVSVSKEELHGVIKGSGYLCGCQSCNFSKALNAYEFERHAGCKTKHPNNHIYFENGKTIYQIVQELRSTPENLLFDTIQTVTGSPINQKAFRSWKESFQAATRELQRIYGKEDLNL